MAKAVSKRRLASDTEPLWVGGLTLADFLIPAEKTPVAQLTAAIAEVALDMSLGHQPVGQETFLQETYSDAANVSPLMSLTSLAGWTDEPDQADRKVVWPWIDPQLHMPRASVADRIADNLAAIKLANELAQSPRAATEQEMAQLLRYCGWGGLARIFSPDGSAPQPLAAQRDELASITSEAQFKALQSSVNTAYFTHPALIESVWSIVQHMGFKGGRVLEPSSGPGHFIAHMPQALKAKTDITAVELDPTSAKIAEVLFAPYGLQVHNCGLEQAKLPKAFFDLVVGNVPFGNFRTKDTSKQPYSNWSIHNWFLAKSLELVRPGGLVAVFTSKHSMDSNTSAHREWLAAHAELLGAFRMPTLAFEASAGTEAVADLLVFKRREVTDFKASRAWIDCGEARAEAFKPGLAPYTTHWQAGRTFKSYASVNKYFIDHPQCMLGKLEWRKAQYAEEAVPVFDGSIEQLAQQLTEVAKAITLADTYVERVLSIDTKPEASAWERYANTGGHMPGSFVLRDGKICISEGEELLNVDSLYSGTARARLLGMLDIRDAAIKTIEVQAASEDEDALHAAQLQLNRVYDHFVAKLGPLSTTANARVMRGDPNWPTMLALEVWNDDDQTATKADIFTKRTVGARKLPEKVDSVKDAMLVSLANLGRIDLKDMAMRCQKPVMEVVNTLKAEALAYRDPQLAHWVTADEYLSGHIGNKIAAAMAAGPAYADNVLALEAVRPAMLGPAEVEARLGATWIPTDVIEQFACQLVEAERKDLSVAFDRSTSTWSVKSSGYGRLEWIGVRALQTNKWGTLKRCALELLEAALNQTPPTITMTLEGKQCTDATATLEAREKWQQIRDEFRNWIYRDEARRDRLLAIYNEAFNQVVPRKFDGAHLHLPGMSMALTPNAHQLNAIWRCIVSGNTLLAHCVGAGKTLTMVCASMELRRLGKAKKPVHITFNSCLEQYTAEFKRLYPQAKVLMATKDDLTGDRRRTFVARIACYDWDAVVMTQSTFERLNLSPEVQQAFLDEQLAQARMMLLMAKDSGAKRSIKEIEKRMKEHEARLERLANSGKADQAAVWFDELGIDYVLADEAHSYKNLARYSKMPRIAGLSNASSQRAFDMFMKTRVIMKARGNKQEGVVFATATPISNSLAEMHTMQVYLQPQTLAEHGILEFDAWSANFGESVTGIELAPDGGGFRTNTRYCRFVNLPELMAIFREVADIQTKSMLKLPTPKIDGGKPTVISCEPSPELKAYIKTLVERADKIRSGAVKPDQDNMLSVTNDGRRAALDLRMVLPGLPADPNGKLFAAAKNIHRIWLDGMDQKHTQMVFCDLGTPDAPGFSVYRELRRLLIDLGIPAEQIEFVHDHDSDSAKAKLWRRFREGVVRVAIGSTQKMGTGTNGQTRLRAIHQICAPWRPSDVEQRDGRGDRQGNLCDSLGLYRYVTSGSFDAYNWNLLDVKARFIDQVMTAERGLRSVEDISMTVLSYAEIKAIASGNPLVLEKATIDAKVQKLSLQLDHWEQDRWMAGRSRADILTQLTSLERKLPLIEQEAQIAQQIEHARFVPAPKLRSVIAGAVSTAEEIGAAFRGAWDHLREDEFGQLGEFELLHGHTGTTKALFVKTPLTKRLITVDRPNMNDLRGVGEATVKEIASLAHGVERAEASKQRMLKDLEQYEKILQSDFEHREELEQARKRQRQIEAELDLDKDTAGTQAEQPQEALA